MPVYAKMCFRKIGHKRFCLKKIVLKTLTRALTFICFEFWGECFLNNQLDFQNVFLQYFDRTHFGPICPESTFRCSDLEPEPTFRVPTWNPEPIGTHFLGSDLEPGTHRNPLRPNLPGTRNPPEPIFLKIGWVPPGTPEPMGSWVPHMPTPVNTNEKP